MRRIPWAVIVCAVVMLGVCGGMAAELGGTGKGSVAETRTLTGTNRDTTVLVDAKRLIMVGDRACSLFVCGAGLNGWAGRDTLIPGNAFRVSRSFSDLDTVITAPISGLIYHQILSYDAGGAADYFDITDFPATERWQDSLRVLHTALAAIAGFPAPDTTILRCGVLAAGDSIYLKFATTTYLYSFRSYDGKCCIRYIEADGDTIHKTGWASDTTYANDEDTGTENLKGIIVKACQKTTYKLKVQGYE